MSAASRISSRIELTREAETKRCLLRLLIIVIASILAAVSRYTSPSSVSSSARSQPSETQVAQSIEALEWARPDHPLEESP